MKATKLVALGLVSMTVLGAAGSVASAAAKDGDAISSTTTGKVTFSTRQDEKPANPDGPGTFNPDKKPGGSSNTTDPDLQLQFVPNFIFGTYDKDGKFNEKVEYDNSKELNLEVMKQVGDIYDNEGKLIESNVQRDNFAQIMNTDQIKNWEFTVTASAFKSGEKTQPRMLMTLNNVTPVSHDIAKNLYGTPATLIGDAKKDLNIGEPVKIGSFLDANQEKSQGAMNQFRFGGKEEGQSGVTLKVPKGLSIENNEVYTSELTWTVQANVK